MALKQIQKKMNVSIGSGDGKVQYKDQTYPGFEGESIKDFQTHPLIGGRLERAFAKSADLVSDPSYPKNYKLKNGAVALTFEQFNKLTAKDQEAYEELPSITSAVSDALHTMEYARYVTIIKDKLEGPAKPLKAMAEQRQKLVGCDFDTALAFVFKVNEIDAATQATVKSVLGVK